MVIQSGFFAAKQNISSVFDNHSALLSQWIQSEKGNGENAIKNMETNKYQPEQSQKISSLPLYRCMYIDPESGYIKLARRDKWTFYREYGEEGKKKWEEYIRFIKSNEDNLIKLMLELKKIVSSILEKKKAKR